MMKSILILTALLVLGHSAFAGTENCVSDEFNEGPERVTTAEFVANTDGSKTLNLHLGTTLVSGALTADDAFGEGLYYMDAAAQKPFGLEASVSEHGGVHFIGIRYPGVYHPDILICTPAKSPDSDRAE